MKKSFMTRALAMGLSLAMAFSLSAATNVSVASAATTPAMASKQFAVRVGGATKSYKASTATQKSFKITKATVGNTDKATVKVNSSKKSIKVTPGTVTGTTVVTLSFKNIKTSKITAKKYRCVVKAAVEPEKPVEEALALSEVKQIASNQIKVTFNKDASANAKDAYKIAANDGTKEIGVKAVTYAEDGMSAIIDTYANVDNGVTYTVTVGELTGTFTASVGDVAKIFISTVNAQQNVKTPIEFTLFDANGIDVTPSVNLDSTCVITLNGTYVTAEKEKASEASVTMGTVGTTVDVTVTYNKGIAGVDPVSETQTITCIAAGQTVGNSVFATTNTINTNSQCAKFYLGLSDKLVAVKENSRTSDIYFCAKDANGNVISYDKYDVESSNDDVATVTVIKDSGKYMKLTVYGNCAGSANLNVSASKNGVVTSYSIPVQVSKGTTAVKMVATASKPVMSNVQDDEYSGSIDAKLLDANGNEVTPAYFTYELSQKVSDDAGTSPITVGSDGTITACGATAGTYSVKVTGSENIDGSYAFVQNVQIQVKALPDVAYDPTSTGIKVTYQVDLSSTTIDENPSSTTDDTITARLYAVYDGLFAGYVNADGTVSDEKTKAYPVTHDAILVPGGTRGIRIATASAITSPRVGVKFGNQYVKFNNSDGKANLFDPATNASTTAIDVTNSAVNTSGLGLMNKVETSKADITINSVNASSGTILCGDAASNGALQWSNLGRTGTYYVEYYYNDANGKFVKTPITKGFEVKNTLIMPTITVTTKKVSSFDEDKLKAVMKASVDMNNNISEYASITDLTNGTDEASSTQGILSAGNLKTTYKYAIVEDNFDNGTWKFYVPINTTFSYQ